MDAVAVTLAGTAAPAFDVDGAMVPMKPLELRREEFSDPPLTAPVYQCSPQALV
jgi:hypothetical protein